MKKNLLIILLVFSFMPVSWSASDNNVAEQLHGVDTATTGFVSKVLQWYDNNMNYVAVTGLMAVESSFIPFPSEVVIPPAVYVSASPDSKTKMNIWLIVAFGTLGAMIGAFINYFLSRWLGRPIVYAFADSKMGHLLLLSSDKVKHAEEYFNKYGNASTFFGRLVPAVRQLISIPAGLSQMPIGSFALFTFMGAVLWNSVLALLGYLAYQAADPSVIEKYSHVLSIVLLSLLVAVILFFVIRLLVKRKKHKASDINQVK